MYNAGKLTSQPIGDLGKATEGEGMRTDGIDNTFQDLLIALASDSGRCFGPMPSSGMSVVNDSGSDNAVSCSRHALEDRLVVHFELAVAGA